MIGFDAMKWAALLNKSPELSNSIMELTVKCTSMKVRRNKPDKLIRNFFPMDEERNIAILLGLISTKLKF